jgi:hypothetical protein
MTKIVTLLLAGALALGAGFAAAQDKPLEQLVIEMADSAAEHTAIAGYYRTKAEEARQEVSRHERMAGTYANGAFPQPLHARQHCDKLAEQYASVAEEYEQLAQLHDKESTRLD